MSWEWKDKTWTGYDESTSAKIEEAFKNYKRGGSSSFSFQASFSPDTYVIDFTTNKQVNQRTNFHRFIRRAHASSPSPSSPSPKVRKIPTGIKAITSLLLPKEVWHINDIANLRFTETDGLPPKLEAPHITLLDSFSSTDRMATAAELFKQAASNVEPFDVTLRGFKYFTHGQKRGFTLYIEPEITFTDKNPLCVLQKALYDQVDGKAGVWLEHGMHPDKFTPHVSLGKVGTKEKLDKIMTEYSTKWEPITFRVTEIYILSKLIHDTVVRHTIPLGKFSNSLPRFNPIPFPENGEYSLNVNWIPPGSTNEDLVEVFASFGAIKGEVVFKTIEHKEYTKGWGNVAFKTREDRDNAMGKKVFAKRKGT